MPLRRGDVVAGDVRRETRGRGGARRRLVGGPAARERRDVHRGEGVGGREPIPPRPARRSLGRQVRAQGPAQSQRDRQDDGRGTPTPRRGTSAWQRVPRVGKTQSRPPAEVGSPSIERRAGAGPLGSHAVLAWCRRRHPRHCHHRPRRRLGACWCTPASCPSRRPLPATCGARKGSIAGGRLGLPAAAGPCRSGRANITNVGRSRWRRPSHSSGPPLEGSWRA